jgi:hypothetical protein
VSGPDPDTSELQLLGVPPSGRGLNDKAVPSNYFAGVVTCVGQLKRHYAHIMHNRVPGNPSWLTSRNLTTSSTRNTRGETCTSESY